ncbi:MAG: choice-of-anchor B family protein [Bacteroidota bacterium]
MKNNIYSLLIIFFANISFGQINMTLLSNLDYQALHNTDLNDIWGHVDVSGKEYALVGAKKGTSIVDVTNPSAPSEVFWLSGMNSTWRDIKTWGNYAYVTTEAQQGLTIIDMTTMPTSFNLPTAFYNGPTGNPWASAHNLFIDENGYAYIFGANRGNGGVIILDVHTNPMAPIEVGVFDNWYAHDGYVKNDTLYGAHVSDGFMSIVDVTVKSSPVLLGTKITPNSFAHNVWGSADGNYAFTTDEKPGAFIAAYDVSNPANIVEVDRIQSSPGSAVIPHNSHVLGDYLITSYYRDGITVHDVSRPNNMVQVGNYDTSPLSGNGFNGCWGAYPYLPSGNVIGSDIEGGLFVLGVNYQKGCYVEGIVTDTVTGLPIAGVEIELIGEIQKDLSKFDGAYAVSTVSTGTKSVKFSKTGYATKTLTFNLQTGLLINEDVQLVPLPPFGFTIKVLDQATNSPINNVQVRLLNPSIEHNGSTNALGEEDFTLYYQSNYEIFVGKWGYVTTCQNSIIDNTTGTITVLLNKGIYDDFQFDFGWTTTSDAATGDWVREVPIGYPTTANPSVDAPYDCGTYAWVTGNADTYDADLDDVDDGTVLLKSPIFDLTGFTDPYLNYARFFYNNFGPSAPDDKLQIILGNGSASFLIENIPSDTAIFHKWIYKSIRVLDFITPTANMILTVKTSDLFGHPNITEAGFDHFFISNSNQLSLEENVQNGEVFALYPNPSIDFVNVETNNMKDPILILDARGKEIVRMSPNGLTNKIDILNITSGVYFVVQGKNTLRFIKK